MASRNIILVIGSVTAKDYEPARLDLIREGVKPKIVRLQPWQIFDGFICDFLEDGEDLFGAFMLNEMEDRIKNYPHVDLDSDGPSKSQYRANLEQYRVRAAELAGYHPDHLACVVLDGNEESTQFLNAIEEVFGPVYDVAV